MSKIDKIVEKQGGISPKTIRPTDLISGKQYLKLIEDFKAYDERRKERISELENELSRLKEENKKLKKFESLPEADSRIKLQERVNQLESLWKARNKTVKEYRMRLRDSKNTISDLIYKLNKK